MMTYNLPHFDTWLNLTDLRFSQYWSSIIHSDEPNQTRIGYDWGRVKNGVVHVDNMFSVPLLAAANVGYLISALPVTGGGLTLVDGPTNPQLEKPSRSGVPAMTFYRDRWSRIFDVGKMHIYALPNPLPRVWAANSVRIMDSGIDAQAFLAEIARLATTHTAVLHKDHTAKLGSTEAQTSLNVRHFDLVQNGFEIDVDAPDGGLLMVNAVAMRQFRAWADGKEVPFTESNGVQTAIAVPAGTRHVSLCYVRRTLLPKSNTPVQECGLAAPHSP